MEFGPMSEIEQLIDSHTLRGMVLVHPQQIREAANTVAWRHGCRIVRQARMAAGQRIRYRMRKRQARLAAGKGESK
jgi:hypothetical protein